ncbi:hypothetical protein LCGC14_0266270 [marine sediment metagenome]|uniref:Uncharacterized protein n=1 Tax=marine sediment metagenome TaxID=412755 RepID=A0A0F9U4V0_9ZZZZ
MEKPISTLINTIEANPECGIFEILNSDNDNPLEWEIKPTTLQLIPNGQGHYLTKAYRIEKNGVYKFAYVDVNTPERIIDYVIYDLKKPSYSYVYDSINIEVIPAVASDCFGSYEVYYSRNNPDLSIEVLEQGLKLSKGKKCYCPRFGIYFKRRRQTKRGIEIFSNIRRKWSVI